MLAVLVASAAVFFDEYFDASMICHLRDFFRSLHLCQHACLGQMLAFLLASATVRLFDKYFDASMICHLRDLLRQLIDGGLHVTCVYVCNRLSIAFYFMLRTSSVFEHV